MNPRIIISGVISCFLPATLCHAANLSDDGSFQLNGYGMVAGDFQSELNRPKTCRCIPIPPDLIRILVAKWAIWETVSGTITGHRWLSLKWQGLASPEQWADYTYEMVGYGDKTVETAQNYGRFGGLSFFPRAQTFGLGVVTSINVLISSLTIPKKYILIPASVITVRILI